MLLFLALPLIIPFYFNMFCRFVYCFNFIGSPQHVMLPVQQASVVQQASPHAFTTLSSNPHPSQTRT